ncbi:T9SS type A sorting domain-containing protein, partial [Dyadobacter endophyticus]|uniref:T9SS type A sorting domain-containing protein n=1 Tax=Dyadobacter endophyticus TaxID=1749036 RepID=UPI0016640B06
GNYGFTIPIPTALKDGVAHQLNVRVKGSTFNVTGGPRALTCSSSARLAADSLSVQADVEEGLFTVAPNPTSGKVLISLMLPVNESGELSIVNLKGDIVWKQKIAGVGERYQQWVDLSAYTDGVYIVVLKTSGKIKTKRVILLK